MADEIPRPRVGNSTTKVRLDMQQDLSGASSVKIYYLKPDEISVGSVNGTVVQTSKIEAVMPTLDQEGDWVLTPWVDGLSGFTGYGDPKYMHVFGIYEVVTQ